MSDLTPYRFPEDSSEIRTLLRDGEPWFVAADVAGALGYVRPNNAVAQHVDDEDRGTTPNQGGGPDLIVVNESGLYALIFGSRLDKAKRFKRWVTAEVLPSIRKTGAYGSEQIEDLDPLDQAQKMLDAIRADRERMAAIEGRADHVEGRVDVVESQLSGVLGHYNEFTALGYAKLEGLDTSRSYLSRLGRMATKIMRERGGEPHTRQDASFGAVNVYPVSALREAVERLNS